MFISSKPIVIIVYLYAISFSMLAVQFAVADVFGLTLTSPITGTPLKSFFLSSTSQNNLGAIQQNYTSTTRNEVVNSASIGLGTVWETIQVLLLGEIFNIFIFFGLPSVWINGFLYLYYILVGITFVALLLGRFI